MKIDHIKRACRKAMQSPCRYRVAAMGFNSKGDLIGVSYNYPTHSGVKVSMHAEMALIHKYRNIHSIVIVRIGRSGNLLPIDPCSNCLRVLNKLGIKIRTLT